jgi:hypothetical protein
MGIPYHTLISGMIHRYIEGDLVEKSKQSWFQQFNFSNWM